MSLNSLVSLNRSYRSKHLSSLIGQDLSIRFLQNSLFKNIIYPVYIFAGMRGTGKTTAARLFALSNLCESFNEFANGNHKIILPCYKCFSCNAFVENKHLDIIELDAASHTGVDTIRSLIDNAFLTPLMGKKKFYIIDEAHMLSKAAFNACLKIMEEPPENVHFILATTEVHKIIDTIRSRSIILYFKPIDIDILSNYLIEICNKESIKISKEAAIEISLISEGSARDALNNIERLRISYEEIDLDIVRNELMIPSRQNSINFIKSIIDEDINLYYQIKEQLKNNSSLMNIFWQNTITLIQENIKSLFISNQKNETYNKLLNLMEIMYQEQDLFFNSFDPIGLLDIWTFKIINKNNKTIDKINNNIKNIEIINDLSIKKTQKDNEKINKETENNYLENNKKINLLNSFKDTIILKDNILGSIFKQAVFNLDSENKKLISIFKKNFLFYKDFINEKKNIYQPIIKNIFGENFDLEIKFEDIEQKIENNRESIIEKIEIKEIIPLQNNINNSFQKPNLEKNTNNIYKKSYTNTISIKKKLLLEDAGPIAKEISKLIPGTTYYVEK
jgi:DNA polymerase-3 subunit gamma/tau